MPRLVTGHDLKKTFSLAPSPFFGRILSALEEAQVAGEVVSRDEALAWINSFLEKAGRDSGQ
jgi:hypothetical protein